MPRRDERTISLENFDPTSHREPALNSPRSLEACRRQGIDPSELIIRTTNEIREMYKDRKLDHEGTELMNKHYEERRREKVRVLIEEREQIIDEEKNGLISFNPEDKKSTSVYGTFGASQHGFSKSGSHMGSGIDSGLIEREKRQLEKIKYRQEKEIKQILDHEAKMQDIKNRQEEKMMKQQEKAMAHDMTVKQRRQEAEERRREQEREKHQRAEEEANRAKLIAQRAYEREMELARREREREREKRSELRSKEEEQKRRQEEFTRQTEEKLMEQQRKVEARRREMEEADRMRQEFQAMQQKEKQMMSEEQRRQHEEKLRLAKMRNDEILNQRRQEFEQKQELTEERKKFFELEREQKKEEARRRAEEQQNLLQQVLDENRRLEEERKMNYYHKTALAEERKKELDQIAEMEKRQKIQQENEKQKYRETIKEQNDERLQHRINNFMGKYQEMEEKVETAQKRKEQELQMKHNLEVIRRADKEENVRRISKMQEYQRAKIMEKIMNDNEKANRVKMERESLMETRQTMRKEVELSKREILENFDKIKKGKMELSTQSGEFRANNSSAQSTRNYQSPSNTGFRSAQSQPPNKLKNTTKSKNNISKNESYRSKGAGNSVNVPREIENLKVKQNHDMLIVLEEEQEDEKQRELQLRNVSDPQDRKRLEKIFGMERAKAHARIQQMADKHDEEIDQLVSKYNN